MMVIKKRFIKLIVWIVLFCLLWAAPGLAGTAQYTYDSLNRLVQVQYDDGTVIQYSYDAAGNRLVRQVTAFQASAPTTGPDSGQLAAAPLARKFSFIDWWPAIWGTRGESSVTTHLPQ